MKKFTITKELKEKIKKQIENQEAFNWRFNELINKASVRVSNIRIGLKTRLVFADIEIVLGNKVNIWKNCEYEFARFEGLFPEPKFKDRLFRVFANSNQRFYIDIKAKTAYEAYQKAKQSDGGDFTAEDDGDWNIEGDISEVRNEK